MSSIQPTIRLIFVITDINSLREKRKNFERDGEAESEKDGEGEGEGER